MTTDQFIQLVAWMRDNEDNGARQDAISFNTTDGSVTLHVNSVHGDKSYSYVWSGEEITGLFALGYTAEEIVTTAYADVENNICEQCEEYKQGWEDRAVLVGSELLCSECFDTRLSWYETDATDKAFQP